MIDLHAHILPGVDDGARDFDESVEMARYLASAGVTDVIATPHYVNETIYMVSKAENQKLVKKLAAKLKEEKIKLNVHLGNEIYIDRDILELVKTKKISNLAGSEYLLVELPLTGEFDDYQEIILDLIQNGYKVILAHPERYLTVQKDLAVARELCEMGVLLQGNLGSIVGKYGKRAQKTLRKMIKAKMVFGFGSDLHRCPQGDFLTLAQKKLGKYYSEAELKQVLSENAQQTL